MVGGVAGAVIGLFAAGPIGAVAGGMVGPLVTITVQRAVEEIQHALRSQGGTRTGEAEIGYIGNVGGRSRLNNVPAQLTSFIGREQELNSLQKLLLNGDIRLVSLTGPGGIGKTRLGLQLATDMLDHFTDGVIVVSLASIVDPKLVVSAIGQTLMLEEPSEQPLIGVIKDFLADKHMLLLLDNFEQVVAARSILTELLAAAPFLKILVTTREVLQLYGEQEFPMSPLQFPSVQDRTTVDVLTDYPAVKLFLQRAVAVKPNLEVTNEAIVAICNICTRLEGLPLAIELAAARSKLFSPEAMLLRLDHRLSELTNGPRDVPDRQRTLRGAIAWSFDLLSSSEQALFMRLAVFVGGWTVQSAQLVCNADGDLSIDMFDGLASLANKSLVLLTNVVEHEPRFDMLETIREFGWEQLLAIGQAAAMQRRHATYMLNLVEETDRRSWSPEQGEWFGRLDQEYDNLRAALRWSIDHRDAELVGRLTGALARFWDDRAYLTEGRAWLDIALATCGDSFLPSVRAKMLCGAGWLAFDQGDLLATQSFQAEALVLFEAAGDNLGMAFALDYLGNVAREHGDYLNARVYFERGLALRREIGLNVHLRSSFNNLGRVVRDQGDYAAAQALFQQGLAIAREFGDVRGSATSLNHLGQMAYLRGDYVAARTLFEESLVLRHQLKNSQGLPSTYQSLGQVAYQQGDYSSARQLFEKSLVLRRQIGNKRSTAEALFNLGNVVREQGEHRRARTFYTQSLQLFAEMGVKQQIAEVLQGLADPGR